MTNTKKPQDYLASRIRILTSFAVTVPVFALLRLAAPIFHSCFWCPCHHYDGMGHDVDAQ